MSARRSTNSRTNAARAGRTSRRSPARGSRKATKPKDHTLWRGLLRIAGRVGVFGFVGLVIYGVWLDLDVQRRFAGNRWKLPAHVYARSLELYEGLQLSQKSLLAELTASGFTAQEPPARPGTFTTSRNEVDLHTRGFRFWDGEELPRRVRVHFSGAHIVALQGVDEVVPAVVRLRPLLIGRILPGHQQDRMLVKLEEVPKHLVDALIAIEDRAFFDHHGVSVRGIGRAIVANLRAGAAVQGGSTITQQLAKNFFLSTERTLWRKLNDIFMAVLLELRYDKHEILQAYLNEIYFGQDGKRAIHGLGSAAHDLFGRDVSRLDLAESALLVGLIQAPNRLNPRRHPGAILERRNLVLAEMSRLGLITNEESLAAQKRELGILAQAPGSNAYAPDFLDIVQRQLGRDYAQSDLATEGLQIFTTLSPGLQHLARSVMRRQLSAMESRGLAAVGKDSASLESAIVLVETSSGEVRALIGGRDAKAQDFNRALDARRQIGSLIKPVVYLTALAQPSRFNLASLLDDEPVDVTLQDGAVWSPGNYDGLSHGRVMLIDALARSYNQATVRLGLELGVPAVLDRLRALGIQRELANYPSALLGTIELTPLEIAQVFQALANEGYLAPLKAITAVTRSDGSPLNRYPLEVNQAAPGPAVSLVVRAMQEVMQTGTGSSVLNTLGAVAVAGKTGTTDGRRDSWFAGFDATMLGVVWVGRDDNGPTRLSGASGALQLWRDIFSSLALDPVNLSAANGLDWHWIDPLTGFRATPDCGGVRKLPFVEKQIPPLNDCTLERYGHVIGTGESVETIGQNPTPTEGDVGSSGQVRPNSVGQEERRPPVKVGIFGLIRRALPDSDQQSSVEDGR